MHGVKVPSWRTAACTQTYLFS